MRMPFPISTFGVIEGGSDEPKNGHDNNDDDNNNETRTTDKKTDDTSVTNNSNNKNYSSQRTTVLPFSMRLMQCVVGNNCADCTNRNRPGRRKKSNGNSTQEDDNENNDSDGDDSFLHDQHEIEQLLRLQSLSFCMPTDEELNQQQKQHAKTTSTTTTTATLTRRSTTTITKQRSLSSTTISASDVTNYTLSPAIYNPMVALHQTSESPQPSLQSIQHPILEQVILDYRTACLFYQRPLHAGVLTTFRFAIPYLRVDDFCDADMLALLEVFTRHHNVLHFITRIDVAKRSNNRHRHNKHHHLGSHGALVLAKLLQSAPHVRHVVVDRNPIGAYGATALFLAGRHVQILSLRRCRLGERGALAFAAQLQDNMPNLRSVDLSANAIGYAGCLAVEQSLLRCCSGGGGENQPQRGRITVDLEGNLVFQEIMNCVTHGLGVLLAFIGACSMSSAVTDSSLRHVVSCGVYSFSLVVLYTSSTLYHSFFSMRTTKWVFEVLDKCAIYILISGSYTPFLQIVLSHDPLWSTYLLSFLWILCGLGIMVEFTLPSWEHRSKFSLAMYLGMGWSALVCLPEVARILPPEAMHLMFLGGVSYTAGVPFFVRDNNLDHAVWHLFVMAGSIFHWLGVYLYVAPLELPLPSVVGEAE